MGKIIAKDGREVSVEDGSYVKDACKEVGVPFSCEDGVCGTCMIDVLDGQDNLSELTEQEQDLARDKEHRLACQCKIKSGEVKIDF